MTKFIITAAVLSAALVGAAWAANAQEFKGKCTELKSDTCAASGWCRWTDRKPVALPNGQTVTPPGYCAFKAGMKAAHAAQTAK